MSYLPRMSKTYKEPQTMQSLDEPEETRVPGAIQPASSLASEKTYNPQIALKHYKYQPHPPPVLPGPSVMDEAAENELYREASKLRRSLSKIDELSNRESQVSIEADEKTTDSSAASLTGANSEEIENPPKRPDSKRISPSAKASKTSTGKKKFNKLNSDRKRYESNRQLVNICLVKTELPESFVAPQTDPETHVQNPDARNPKTETVTAAHCSTPFRPMRGTGSTCKDDSGSKQVVHRSVQCTIFGSPDKTFVIPPPINILLKTLAFVLHEVNKDEELKCTSLEGKRIMTQVQLILGDLCNQTVDRDFGFDVTYSDSKRVEKLLEELQKYVNNIYGTKGQFSMRGEALKKIFLDLKVKELELGILREKIQERDALHLTEVEVKGSDLKNPEVTLQNKRLESEQLLAEIEFSSIELRKYQRALAEADWEIKMGHDQMATMKRSFGSKSRTDILSRKPSLQKFSSESSGKGTKGKEQETARGKKKT